MEIMRGNKNPWVLYETEVPHSRFGDPTFGVSPAETLSPEQLQLLRNAFACQNDGQTRERRHTRRTGEVTKERGMAFEEFREVLKSVVGPDVDDSWVERFFREVDIGCTGQIKWGQLCSYLLLEYTERERASIPRPALLSSQPLVIHCSHNKREPTVRIVAVYHPPPLRYVSVSRGGQITVWNSSLHILKTGALAGDPTNEVANTRRFKGWTTDAVFMGNVQKVAISTDRRDLHFVSVTTDGVSEDFHLLGFRNALTALCYWCDVQNPRRPSLLLIGDEKGGIHLMWFLNPLKGLFKSPAKKERRPQRIYFRAIGEHHSTVSYRHIPNVHQESINRLMFEATAGVIMSSSESNATTVVFTSTSEKQERYIWKCTQGAKCFDYNATLQLMVTGGYDRAVRLWAQFVTTRPVATLLGHCTAVLDVAIYQPGEQIFSYSRDSDLRVWDISTHQCLKTITLQFPCQQPGQIAEHGPFPFLLLSPPLPEQARPHLVVGRKDYLALLHLQDKEKGQGGSLISEGMEPSVSGGPALSCVLYNPTLRQVVTGHANSSVSLWDIETGRGRLQVSNAHGEEEITCMSLDSSHRRLITGAGNGTIKVWNLLNGLNLHKLEPITHSDVTGVTCLHDDKLLAVGWSQRIVQYDIEGTKDLLVRADLSWKSSCVHKSDILAVSQCSSLGVVATASYDGEIVVWRLETQGPLLHLWTETNEGLAPPVDSLLFLQHRARTRTLKNRGVLVSSQAGQLHFWSITGQMHTYGNFYAPEEMGERVLSLSSDQPKNSILVSGDTAGRLQIWDISHYALDIVHERVGERPPLLQSWKAHERLLGVEVLEVSDRQFILTASSKGAPTLWTRDGDLVGSFGQQMMWDITRPVTYQSKKEQKPNQERRCGGVKNQARTASTGGQIPQEECCSEVLSTSTTDHNQPQQPMCVCSESSSVSSKDVLIRAATITAGHAGDIATEDLPTIP